MSRSRRRGSRLLGLLLALALLPALPAAAGAAFHARLPFPDGSGVAVVAEGRGETPQRGSYAVRVYAGGAPGAALADFVVGAVRARSGAVEHVAFRDLDRDGADEIVVLMRDPLTGRRSADALGCREGVLYLLEAAADLAPGADPFAALEAALAACDCVR